MNISFGEGLYVSLIGLCVVFCILLILAAATTLVGKLIHSTAGKGAPQPVASPVPAEPQIAEPEDGMGQILAILQGVLSEESGIPVDLLVITSVQEVQ